MTKRSRSPAKKKKTVNYQKSLTPPDKYDSKGNKIIEDYEGDDDDIIADSQSNTKMKSRTNRPDSELDHTKDDFIAKAERQIDGNSFMDEDSNKDISSSDKDKKNRGSPASVKLDKEANEGGSRSPLDQKPFNIHEY